MTNQEAIDFIDLITQYNVEVMPLTGKDGKNHEFRRLGTERSIIVIQFAYSRQAKFPHMAFVLMV